MSTEGPDYAVIDVETTMNSPVGSKSTPFHPSNQVVMRGFKRGTYPTAITHQRAELKASGMRFGDAGVDKIVKLLVGHNIGFDIHHMRNDGDINLEFLGTVNLWDTALAEYLLTAQRTQFASLDELSAKYGGTPKDDSVTKMFEAGYGADHIEPTKLAEYLKADLHNTEKVFIEQFKKAQELEMVPLIRTQMDALAATIEMTYNGLAVDEKQLMGGAMIRRAELNMLETAIKLDAARLGFPDFNMGSTKQLSAILFGGEREVVERVSTGITKTGKTTYKNVKRKVRVGAHFLVPVGVKKNKKGDFPTDEATLKDLLDLAPLTEPRHRFVESILQWREKEKQLSTYWEGLLKQVMPGGRIHHSLNHTVTRTGRLSSSEPNLQNVANSDIKQVFVSRWGEDGYLVEADFKQLEMVELAILSGDMQLITDIQDGVDMHEALFNSMYHRPMKKEERKKFKRCSFCLVYGGGPSAIAEQGGIQLHEAKRFIDTFYTRYPGVKEWHDKLLDVAARSRVNNGLKDADTGLPMGEYTMESEYTHRRWWFREYPTKWGTVNFSPSELKNYPVQGGATGDKVPLCIGKLYRVLRNHPTLKDKCLMVNTVHDSVLFDVHKDVLTEALPLIKETMERTPEFYEQEFGYKMPLPLKVELSIGWNWLDQKEVHFDKTGFPTWGPLKEAA